MAQFGSLGAGRLARRHLCPGRHAARCRAIAFHVRAGRGGSHLRGPPNYRPPGGDGPGSGPGFGRDQRVRPLPGLLAQARGFGIAVYLAHLSTGREQRLVEGEQRLRMMLDNTADVVLRSAPDGTLLWASPSLRRVFGWDTDDVVGNVFRLTSSQDRRAARAAFTDAVLTQRSEYTHRTIVACADGAQRWAETSSTIVRALDGTVESVVSSIRDVTAQVETEQTLAQREQQYRLLAENATDAVFLMDSEWVIQWASPTVSTQFGYERDEEDVLHPDDVEPARQVRDRLLGGRGDHETRPCRLIHADGSIVWVTHAVGLLRDDDGLPLFFVCQYQDITKPQRVQAAKTAHSAVKTDAHRRRSDR